MLKQVFIYDWINKCSACDIKFASRYAAEKYCKKHKWIVVQ